MVGWMMSRLVLTPCARATYLFACALTILLVFARHSAAEDWPQFRGPTGDGLSNAKNVPLNWSATDHIVWKQAIPGSVWSSPTLFRGKLYLTTATEVGADQVSLRAICVNAA